jgi:S-adenosylmethionine uptake transporter
MMDKRLIAILWFVLSLTISILNDSITKVLNNSISSLTVVFWRFVFSFILLLPIVFKSGLSSIKTPHIYIHILRGLILSAAMSLWCYGMKFVPIATVTLMSFTIPMFTILMAGVFLHEKISCNTIFATAIGFIGSILTLSPEGITFPLTSGIFVIASILFATLDILNKMLLNKNEFVLPMIFYSNLFSTVFIMFVPNAVSDAMQVNFHQFSQLFVLGIGANLILFCIIKAFSNAKASFLAPVKYLELLMSAFVGVLFFNEMISTNILVGGILIVISSIIVNQRHQTKIKKGA